jgi:protein transport protein SEC24
MTSWPLTIPTTLTSEWYVFGQFMANPQSSLPKLPTLLSTQIRNLLSHFERVFGNALSVSIARQNVDGLEIEFANLLVEDSNNGALAYPECKLFAKHG